MEQCEGPRNQTRHVSIRPASLCTRVGSDHISNNKYSLSIAVRSSIQPRLSCSWAVSAPARKSDRSESDLIKTMRVRLGLCLLSSTYTWRLFPWERALIASATAIVKLTLPVNIGLSLLVLSYPSCRLQLHLQRDETNQA